MIATTSTAMTADAALTVREAEILDFIAHGLTSKQIARELNISPYTVNTHRDNLRRKLGVHNGAQLAYCQAARHHMSTQGNRSTQG